MAEPLAGGHEPLPAGPGATRAETPAVADAVAWLGAGLGAALWCWFAAPVPGFFDAGELVAASRELGVIHPPGHPAWLSLAGLQEAIPLGPVSARLAWVSAIACGVGVFAAVRLSRRLLGALGLPSAAQEVGAGASAVLLAASGSIWLVATRVEVYGLAFACNAVALAAAAAAADACGALGPGRPLDPAHVARQRASARLWSAVAALAVALGLLNHHYVALFALPAIVVAGWPALRRGVGWRAMLTLVACGAVAGLGYLALPLRAAQDIELRWADPIDWRGLWDHVRAAHFTRSVTEAGVSPGDGAATMLAGLVERTGPALGGIGLAGLVLSALRPHRLVAAAWLALVGGIGAKAVMRVDLRTPDDHGYALLAVLALALGAAVVVGGVAAALTRVQARLRWLALALIVALGAGQIALLASDPDAAPWRQRGADAVDDAIRAKVPPAALFLPVYYGTAFQEQAFRLAEGRRPDIVAAHLSFRAGDTDGGRGFARSFIARHPADAGLARAAQALGKTPVGNLLARVETSPVVVEHDPDLRLPPSVVDVGAIAHRLLPERERKLDYSPGPLRAKAASEWDKLGRRLGDPRQLDHGLRSALLWQHALDAAHALRRGWREAARDALQRARKIAPRDQGIAALDARLRRLDDAWARGDAKGYRELWTSWTRLDLTALTSGR